jgi:hypothetical protein
MKVTRLGALAMGAALAFGACNSAATPAPSGGGGASPSSGGASKGTLKIAMSPELCISMMFGPAALSCSARVLVG